MGNALPSTRHLSVLPGEVMEWLAPALPGTVLDCTFGGGGHSRAFLDSDPDVRVIALDRDVNAIARAAPLCERYGERLLLHHGSFRDLPALLAGERVNVVLADLGVSTDQLFEGRGFSFRDEDSLDMRMDQRGGATAADLVNDLGVHELVAVLRQGGVGNEAKGIARAIARARPLATAAHLREVVAAATPAAIRARTKIHPATVVFQALRIAVNDELGEISHLLQVLPDMVAPAARVGIISFHSLEDALVARTFRGWSSGGEWSASMPGAHGGEPVRGTLLTSKAVVASDDEVARNPSARSARFRVFEFLPEVVQ